MAGHLLHHLKGNQEQQTVPVAEPEHPVRQQELLC